jgi:2-keto-4-pentenoate hydratase/2-oxohepta-3-ene-1,7-dioic acid hydratase in catechol pathway
MKLIRFLHKNRASCGILQGGFINIIKEDWFGTNTLTGDSVSPESVRILPPSLPSKIVAVGLNYGKHASELGMDMPTEPLIFIKPPSSIIGHCDKIVYPPCVSRLDYEAELAFVIKEKCKGIEAEEAGEYILGYTCFNDITARDIQKKDGQWTRAKSFDTFAPAGPVIATQINLENTAIRLYHNGKVRQESCASDLIFPPHEILSYVSKIMSLNPGDIIATGTPPGIGAMNRGDTVEVEIDGIGRLKNSVV